jgi:hypothetical protein
MSNGAILIGALTVLALIWHCLVSEILGAEMLGWLNLVPGLLLRIAVRRLPIAVRSEYGQEWNDILGLIGEDYPDRPVTRLAAEGWYALGVVHAAGQMERTLSGDANDPVSGAEWDAVDPAYLATRLIQQDDERGARSRWRRGPAPLMAFAAERLPVQRAADLALSISDAQRADVALRWLRIWLRWERIYRRQPKDVVLIFRQLRRAWPGGPAELRYRLLEFIGHWSWTSRQQAERLLRDEPDAPSDAAEEPGTSGDEPEAPAPSSRES